MSIARNKAELEAHGIIATVAQNTDKRGRPGTAHYLNEGQAVTGEALSKTKAATEVRIEIVNVFIAYRHGQLELSETGKAELRQSRGSGPGMGLRSGRVAQCGVLTPQV